VAQNTVMQKCFLRIVMDLLVPQEETPCSDE